MTNPNNALLQGKSLKITIDLHCLIPAKIGNLMTFIPSMYFYRFNCFIPTVPLLGLRSRTTLAISLMDST